MDDRLRVLGRAWAAGGDDAVAEALDRAHQRQGGRSPMRSDAYARLLRVLHRRCYRCPRCGSTGNTDFGVYDSVLLRGGEQGWYLTCASCGAMDGGWMHERDAPWKSVPPQHWYPPAGLPRPAE